MEKVEHAGSAPIARHSAATTRPIPRFPLFLKRSLLTGAFALLTLFLCTSAVGQTPVASEEETHLDASTERSQNPPRHHHASDADAIPLLFLALIGLGALTLSQTRPSSEYTPRADTSRAGKNVESGQELPEHAAVAHGLATR